MVEIVNFTAQNFKEVYLFKSQRNLEEYANSHNMYKSPWLTDDDIKSFCSIGNRTLKVKESAPCMLVLLMKLFAIIMQNNMMSLHMHTRLYQFECITLHSEKTIYYISYNNVFNTFEKYFKWWIWKHIKVAVINVETH